jgi:hypothetical protein
MRTMAAAVLIAATFGFAAAAKSAVLTDYFPSKTEMSEAALAVADSRAVQRQYEFKSVVIGGKKQRVALVSNERLFDDPVKRMGVGKMRGGAIYRQTYRSGNRMYQAYLGLAYFYEMKTDRPKAKWELSYRGANVMFTPRTNVKDLEIIDTKLLVIPAR